MTIMNEHQIAARLCDLTKQYVEKTGEQPATALKIEINADGVCDGYFYTYDIRTEYLVRGRGSSASAYFDEISDKIAALESAEDVAKREFAKQIAKTIEAGIACGAGEKIMAGIIASAKANSENAITHQPNTPHDTA